MAFVVYRYRNIDISRRIGNFVSRWALRAAWSLACVAVGVILVKGGAI
jgi:hypothetical protein